MTKLGLDSYCDYLIQKIQTNIFRTATKLFRDEFSAADFEVAAWAQWKEVQRLMTGVRIFFITNILCFIFRLVRHNKATKAARRRPGAVRARDRRTWRRSANNCLPTFCSNRFLRDFVHGNPKRANCGPSERIF